VADFAVNYGGRCLRLQGRFRASRGRSKWSREDRNVQGCGKGHL